MFIAAWQCIKKGDWVGAFVDNLCWPLIIIGLLLLASPMLNLPAALGTVGQWLAILCAVVVFLFSARSKGWTVGRFISGAGKLYDITSWLGFMVRSIDSSLVDEWEAAGTLPEDAPPAV